MKRNHQPNQNEKKKIINNGKPKQNQNKETHCHAKTDQ
jgi:hypothetical protein